MHCFYLCAVLTYTDTIIHFAGGFYSDDVGYVGESCKRCPNGFFVQFDKTPGTSRQDCKSCPEGNNENIFFFKESDFD